jgi:hypothetical protein
MYAYLANTFHFQPERENPVQTVFGWLRQKLEARQALQAEKRRIAYLRTLDRHFLEDMGVDIASLGEIPPTLASFSPCLVAMNAFSGRSMPPVHMSSR